MALTARGARLCFPLLLLFALLLAAAPYSAAEDKFCSQYGGVVDGNVLGISPVQVTIDTDCTFQNWPRSNPLTATINFQTNDPSIYLIIFDNVWYDGNMACANIDHKLWVVNSEEGAFSGACQNIMIPAETIYKRVPATTAAIGLPFIYRLTIPAMNFPVGEDPSPNDIGSIVVWDDLTATGAALTLVGLTAYYKGSGTPVPVTNLGDSKHVRFTLPDLAKGLQIVVEMEVVLDDTPANQPGMSFTNTATWQFSRWIDLDEDGLLDANEFFNPLPGEAGISAPMTIVAPVLVVNKTSPATAINVTDTATFTIDVQNSGGGDAWNAVITDRIPAGMCATDPTATVTAEIVAAGGMPGTGTALTKGTDYSVSYGGCQLILAMLTDRARIAPEQHLLIMYRTMLDPGFTDDGATLTNVAGATQWFSADSSHAGRRQFDRTLTDGTPGIVDFQDSQTVTAALHGYYFEKTVRNLTSLADPAFTAAPGDRLRYKLRVFNVDQTIDTVTINDTLNPAYFELATFGNVTITAAPGYNAGYTFDYATGLLQIFGAPVLNVDVHGEFVVEFDIALKTGLADGTPVPNQAALSSVDPDGPGPRTPVIVNSDDPYVNGVASPDVTGDEDPTIVLIKMPGPLVKANTRPVATVGERFEYTITVPETATIVPLYDVQILDTLPANLRFVSARVVSGGAWALSTTVTGNSLIIEDTATGIDIPANGQAKIAITVELLNSAPNQASVFFNNSASYTYNRANGVDGTKLDGAAGTTANMTVVEPLLTAAKTARFVSPAGKPVTDPATVGDVIEYVLTIPNSGTSPAFDTNIVDTLPQNVAPVAGSAAATINGAAVSGFIADPATPSGTTLVWGRGNGDGSLDIPAGQSLVLTYQVTVVDASSVSSFTNRAYVDWTSLDEDYPIDPVGNPSPGRERTGAGCPSTTLPNDYCFGPAAVTVNTVDSTSIAKSVYTDSYAETPASTADPAVRVGDTVTYDLTLNLQEYTTRSVMVEDALPTGMELQSFSIIAGPNFSYTLGLQPAAGATGALRWEFGDIINTPSNNNTPIDPLVIRYVAKVVTAAPAAGVGYGTSILLDNQARLSYSGGDPAVYPARLTAAERIDVRQPALSAMAKTGAVAGRTAIGNGTNADPYQVDVATDVMNFRLSSCNNGLAPAYNVRITDILASQLDETSITAPVVAVAGTTVSAGTGYVYTPPAGRGGSMIFVLNTPVNPGQCVAIDYTIRFHTDFGPNQTWSNSAALNEYRSLPADGRIYASSAAAQVWMTNQVLVQRLSKALMSPAEATIGETVIYQITVPRVPVSGALADVVVSDTLDAALEYVSAAATLNGAPLAVTPVQSGQALTWALGTIPAGQQAVITLTARVANNDQANAGTSIANAASYTYTDIPAGALTGGVSSPLAIVEPSVTATKSVNPSTPPTAGDILTFTVNLTAASGAGFSSAFDAALADAMSLGLVYVAGSGRVGGAAAEPAVTGDGVGTPQTLAWSGIDIPEGTTVAVTYAAQVTGSAAPGQTLTNSAVARWTGLDGANSNERTGSGTPACNDYITQPVTVTVMARLEVSVVKSVINETTGENPGANARPGDTLRYTLVLTNGSVAPVNSASVVDELAAQFAPGSLQLVTVPAGANTAATNPSGGTSGTGIVDIRSLTLGAQGDPTATQAIVFRATLAPVIANGTRVLNQAVLSATGLGPVPSNQTSTLISSAPVFQVRKTSQDMTGDPSVLMTGEVLRYTITVKNIGDENAVNVVLRDAIPANTAYVAGSTALNGVLVADPAPGLSRLESGLLINAPEDATPGAMRADANPAATSNVATITFDVRVGSGVANGTVIANQAFVNGGGDGGVAFPQKPSDDPATPAVDDPTVNTVTGLVFTKSVFNVTTAGDGGAARPGDTLRYRIEITNNGTVPLANYSVSDEIQQLQPADPLLFVPGTLTLVTVPAGVDTSRTDPRGGAKGAGIVDVRGVTVAAGQTVFFEFAVQLAPVITNGTEVLNQARLAAAGLEVLAGNIPRTVIASAPAWRVEKTVSPREVYAGNSLRYAITVKNIGDENAVNVVLRDAMPANTAYVAGSTTLNGVTVGDVGGASPLQDGTWKISSPEDPTPGVMRADAGDNSGNVATITFDVTVNADVGDSTMISNQAFVNGAGTSAVAFPEAPSDDPTTGALGDPTLAKVLQPNGIVYDSVRRTPLAGATLTMRRVSTRADLPGSCFSDPAQQNQVTPANGAYKFDLMFDPTNCPAGADYLIAVTNAPDGYAAGTSRIIPSSNTHDPVTNNWVSYSVPQCPADAVSSTAHCEAQASTTVPARGAVTTYYLHLALDDDSMPEDSQIFNNHIPVDPNLDASVAITKTSSLINVTRGQLVPYTITLKNILGGVITDLELIDTLPPGFKYVEGSSRFDGTPREPVTGGRQLRWGNLELNYNEPHTLQFLIIVGSGVSEGKYVNRAQVRNTVINEPVSAEATATVRVIPDPTFDCTDVIGKVFDDRDLNGRQDAGERGLSGVRVATARGLIAITDEHGRFHIACAAVPDDDRGSNFILKLDDRTLPTGYRVTTENPRVQRATRGKMLRFNFGATIHHAVSMDVADGAFEPEGSKLRMQWQPRIDLLLNELRKAPSVLRLSYLADVENKGLVEKRLKALKKEISGKWDGGYRLTIETEVFWRRGSPP